MTTTKYEMPALTDQERADAIKECEYVLDHSVMYQPWVIVMAKATLAALTADAKRAENKAMAMTERAEKAEAELAALAAQKPFMYGIMTANGDAYFEEFCVSSDPAWLEDEIWEWNNGLADNEPKNRVVPLFTRAAPVHVLKPINRPDFSQHHQFRNRGLTADMCLEHRDSLWEQAINAAGYEVKE